MKTINNFSNSILIIDDNSENLRVLSNILKPEGYKIRIATNGEQTLKSVVSTPPDLILLYILMPKMNGYEICERLKKDESTKEIPVIFLSALDDIQDKLKGFAVGGVDYITKPFQTEEVLARVRTHLELKKSKEELHNSYIIIKKQKQQIEYDLKQAKQTQLALFPKSLPNIPRVRISYKYIPIRQIGGDYYDIIELGDGKYGIMVGDATGHDISAALITFMISGIFKNAIKKTHSTEVTLQNINQDLYLQIPEGKFSTMFYGIYDSVDQTLLYTSAAHPSGILIRKKTQEIIELNTYGSLLGVFSNQESNFTEEKVQLFTGDKIIIYTDALIEVLNESGEMIDFAQFSEFFQNNSGETLEQLLDNLINYSISFSQSGRLEDDCTIIGMELF